MDLYNLLIDSIISLDQVCAQVQLWPFQKFATQFSQLILLDPGKGHTLLEAIKNLNGLPTGISNSSFSWRQPPSGSTGEAPTTQIFFLHNRRFIENASNLRFYAMFRDFNFQIEPIANMLWNRGSNYLHFLPHYKRFYIFFPNETEAIFQQWKTILTPLHGVDIPQSYTVAKFLNQSQNFSSLNLCSFCGRDTIDKELARKNNLLNIIVSNILELKAKQHTTGHSLLNSLIPSNMGRENLMSWATKSKFKIFIQATYYWPADIFLAEITKVVGIHPWLYDTLISDFRTHHHNPRDANFKPDYSQSLLIKLKIFTRHPKLKMFTRETPVGLLTTARYFGDLGPGIYIRKQQILSYTRGDLLTRWKISKFGDGQEFFFGLKWAHTERPQLVEDLLETWKKTLGLGDLLKSYTPNYFFKYPGLSHLPQGENSIVVLEHSVKLFLKNHGDDDTKNFFLNFRELGLKPRERDINFGAKQWWALNCATSPIDNWNVRNIPGLSTRLAFLQLVDSVYHYKGCPVSAYTLWHNTLFAKLELLQRLNPDFLPGGIKIKVHDAMKFFIQEQRVQIENSSLYSTFDRYFETLKVDSALALA